MDGFNNNQWKSQSYVKTPLLTVIEKIEGETHAAKKYLNRLMKMHCCHGDDMDREKH